MMALRARYHFNPRVPSGTKIFIYFSFDANFHVQTLYFHFRSTIFLKSADIVTKHSLNVI